MLVLQAAWRRRVVVGLGLAEEHYSAFVRVSNVCLIGMAIASTTTSPS
jgi:hypothetical protein